MTNIRFSYMYIHHDDHMFMDQAGDICHFSCQKSQNNISWLYNPYLYIYKIYYFLFCFVSQTATWPFDPASMSTRHMGHFLFVVSHWSTHSIWKRCMQGNLLTSSPSSNSLRHIVHFSCWSSSTLQRFVYNIKIYIY